MVERGGFPCPRRYLSSERKRLTVERRSLPVECGRFPAVRRCVPPERGCSRRASGCVPPEGRCLPLESACFRFESERLHFESTRFRLAGGFARFERDCFPRESEPSRCKRGGIPPDPPVPRPRRLLHLPKNGRVFDFVVCREKESLAENYRRQLIPFKREEERFRGSAWTFRHDAEVLIVR